MASYCSKSWWTISDTIDGEILVDEGEDGQEMNTTQTRRDNINESRRP
jgi:hypothetical protein